MQKTVIAFILASLTLSACTDPVQQTHSDIWSSKDGLAKTKLGKQKKEPVPELVATSVQPAISQIVLPNFAELAEALAPSVVNIKATPPKIKAPTENIAQELAEKLKEFGSQDKPLSMGVGSGFFISEDGYLVTNAHVVKNTGEITVKTRDKKEYKATILGVDDKTDLALLKVDGNKFTPIKFGSIDSVRPGDWVLAIGAPFGFDQSVTAGIVSAKSRLLPDGSIVPFLQTDVAINPGNSGGPLINLNGEVVGVNSQIYSRSGGYMGISFAIPSDEVKKVADLLKKDGKIERGKIGVMLQPLDPAIAKYMGLDSPKGALVLKIVEGSPAFKAGFKQGDIILDIDGVPVENSNDVVRAISNEQIGKEFDVKVWRDKEMKKLKVSSRQIDMPEKQALKKQEDSGALTPLTAPEKRALGVNGGVRAENGKIKIGGIPLAKGDIVVSIDGVVVNNQADYEREVAKKPKEPRLVLHGRGDVLKYTVVQF